MIGQEYGIVTLSGNRSFWFVRVSCPEVASDRGLCPTDLEGSRSHIAACARIDRSAALHGNDSAQLPIAGDLIKNPAAISEPLALSERQGVQDRTHETVGNIRSGRAIRTGIGSALGRGNRLNSSALC